MRGPHPRRWRGCLAAVLLTLLAPAVLAQQGGEQAGQQTGQAQGAAGADAPAPAPAPTPAPALEMTIPSPVLTIDQERFYTESAFGLRVKAEIAAEQAALATENRRIEQQLMAEEQALTDRRPTLAADAFRALADDFDARVEQIRASQDAKSRALVTLQEEERQRFLTLALPVLGELVRGSGAVVILDRRAVFVAADAIDVTERAIAAMDAAAGPGARPEAAPAPEDAPPDAPPDAPADPTAPAAPGASP